MNFVPLRKDPKGDEATSGIPGKSATDLTGTESAKARNAQRSSDRTASARLACKPAHRRRKSEGSSMLRQLNFKSTNRVLLLVCVMYLITYIDRVNISTAAPAMQKDLGAHEHRARLGVRRVRLPLCVLSDRRRLARRSPRAT